MRQPWFGGRHRAIVADRRRCRGSLRMSSTTAFSGTTKRWQRTSVITSAPALMNGLRGRPRSCSSCTSELNALPDGSRPTRAHRFVALRLEREGQREQLGDALDRKARARLPDLDPRCHRAAPPPCRTAAGQRRRAEGCSPRHARGRARLRSRRESAQGWRGNRRWVWDAWRWVHEIQDTCRCWRLFRRRYIWRAFNLDSVLRPEQSFVDKVAIMDACI